MRCLLRRDYKPAALLAAYPLKLRHSHKQLVFAMACPPDAAHHGSIGVTRWSAAPLPDRCLPDATDVTAVPGYYDYAGDDTAVWHVNFADPQLFVAYGSRLPHRTSCRPRSIPCSDRSERPCWPRVNPR